MNVTAMIMGARGIVAGNVCETEMVESTFGFDGEDEAQKWATVNDGVMGGVSDGRYEITSHQTLRFFGTVSLENNGGFASIRSAPRERDLSAFGGILIRVRGDGKRYALNLRTDVPIMAGSYRVKFDTEAGKWQELFFPFEDFQAASFGVPLKKAPPLEPAKVRSFGFTISENQAGPFSLEVDWIKAGIRRPG